MVLAVALQTTQVERDAERQRLLRVSPRSPTCRMDQWQRKLLHDFDTLHRRALTPSPAQVAELVQQFREPDGLTSSDRFHLYDEAANALDNLAWERLSAASKVESVALLLEKSGVAGYANIAGHCREIAAALKQES